MTVFWQFWRRVAEFEWRLNDWLREWLDSPNNHPPFLILSAASLTFIGGGSGDDTLNLLSNLLSLLITPADSIKVIRYNSLDSKSHHLIAHTRQRAIMHSPPAAHFTWPVSLSSFILPSTHLIVQLQIYKRARVLPLITGVPKIHSGTRSVTRQWPIDFLINLTIVINRSHPPTYARGRLFFWTRKSANSRYIRTLLP